MGEQLFKMFQYRLYPSKAQAKRMEATLETCRRWDNTCLAERRDAYRARGERISRFDQGKQIKTLRATNPYANAIHTHVLHVVCGDLDKAFRAFFRRVKAGGKAGYPRFKGKNRFHSFGFAEYGNGFKIDGRRLRLFGIGRVAVRWHRPIEGKIKTVRIVRKAGKWYASFACEVEPQPLVATGREVGIDVGIASLITTSDGEKVAHPALYRAGQRKLRVIQRRVARRKKGGSNRRKAIVQLQRQHARIANQRKDYQHKLAHDLVQRYDRIAIEDLRITNMFSNPH